MIPATFFAYSISGLHFGLWIQRPLPALVPLVLLHMLCWVIWGRGDASAIGFWLLRPVAYAAGVAVAYLSFVLFGSPVSKWRVWVKRGRTPSILTQNPRVTLGVLAQSMIDHINQPSFVPDKKFTELHPEAVQLWPLHAHVDYDIATGKKDTLTVAHLTVMDMECSGYYNHSKYLLSMAPGHQIVAEWFVAHTIGFLGTLSLWEIWPPHESRTPWGFVGFGLGYPLVTLALVALARCDTFKLWSHPFKARIFWINWIVFSFVATTCAGAIAYVDSLGEFWSGMAISMGVTALVVVISFYVWCCEAARHLKGEQDSMPHYATVSHYTHAIRNLFGSYASIVYTDPV